MPSRTAQVLIKNNRGDPFLGALFGLAKAFIGKKIFKETARQVVKFAGTRTGRILSVAGSAAAGTALVSVGQQIAPGAGAVGPPAAAARAGQLLVFDPATGQHVPMRKKRRRRGITATELSGFRKINRLLSSVGMTPRRARRRSS